MLFPFAFQLQDPWYIRYKPSDEISDDVYRELKHEHESEAGSNHVPIMLVLLVRWGTVKVTTVSGKKINNWSL